jgi:hypothetical protein
MQLHVHRQTQRRLARVIERLSELFPDMDPAILSYEVRVVSRSLIAEARFCDYVPVLTYRLVRERLEDGQYALPEAA